MDHRLTRLLLAAERLGLTDPDTAWLPPAWCYKVLWLLALTS